MLLAADRQFVRLLLDAVRQFVRCLFNVAACVCSSRAFLLQAEEPPRGAKLVREAFAKQVGSAGSAVRVEASSESCLDVHACDNGLTS